jgi:hypothetical protein
MLRASVTVDAPRELQSFGHIGIHDRNTETVASGALKRACPERASSHF